MLLHDQRGVLYLRSLDASKKCTSTFFHSSFEPFIKIFVASSQWVDELSVRTWAEIVSTGSNIPSLPKRVWHSPILNARLDKMWCNCPQAFYLLSNVQLEPVWLNDTYRWYRDNVYITVTEDSIYHTWRHHSAFHRMNIPQTEPKIPLYGWVRHFL